MIDLRIFVSSPHDVGNERGVCSTVVSRLQLEFRGLVRLYPIFWENELLRSDQPFQSQIPRASESDACIFILWSWFGTPLPPAVAVRPDGTTYLSGTEFEFEDAMTSRRARGTPDIFVYRKVADVPVSVRSRDVELMQRSQRDALDGFLDKWFRGEGGTFKAAFYEFDHPAGFEKLLETHLRRWIIEELEKAGVEAAAVHREAQWKGSPFRGLKPFDIDDALIFCGRTQAVTELLDLLRGRAAAGRPWALVVGRSGAGKSSLARAGLLPMLTQPEVIQGTIAWRRAVFRPSDVAGRPLDALAAAILSETALPEIAAGGTGAAELAKLLGENPAAVVPLIRLALARLGDTARAALPPGSAGEARLALVIDQFEEIFTQEGLQSADRAGFVAALNALAGSGQVWIVATMRADFYPLCQDLPPVFLELSPREAVYELMPPTPEEISQMIRRPARLAGLEFEKRVDHDEGLDDVLRDAAIANPGSLPLLQFALDELYRRAGQGRLLRFADYEQMGRLEGALQEHAETELKALSEAAQAALPLVLSHLVQLDLKTGAIAQRRMSYARVAADPHCRELIDSFVDKRLFERDRGSDGEAVISVAHEALLRGWKRAQEWIERNKAFLRLRSRIGAAEVLWREEGRPDRLLLPEGKGLEDAAALKAERGAELSAAELAYIDQSLALAQRARGWRRARAFAAGLAAVALSAAGGWYYWAYVMPMSAYYEDIQMRWGLPEGQRRVSAEAASHREVTYRLWRHGAWGHNFKAEVLNGYGKCAQNVDFDSPFGDQNDAAYTSKEICTLEFKERDGSIERMIAYDRAGREIYTLAYVAKGRAEYRVADELRPLESGASIVVFKYIEAGPNSGLSSDDRYTDATGEPKPSKDGIFGFHYEYDDLGRTIEVQRLSKNWEPIDLNKRASIWQNVYDAAGRIVEARYYNSSRAKMLGAGGYWRVAIRYDNFGNVVSEEYHDVDDKLIGQQHDGAVAASAAAASPETPGKLVAARQVMSRDDRGDAIETRWLDWQGHLTRNDTGTAARRRKFDREGRLVEVEQLDENLRRSRDKNGDIAWQYDYDAAGNITTERYSDENRQPDMSLGYSVVQKTFDGRGNKVAVRYFDADGKPARDKAGIGEIRYRFDARDQAIEVSWFDDAERPVLNKDSYSRHRLTLDGYGRVTEMRFFGTDGQPIISTTGAILRVTYDENGNKTSAVVLDASGKLVNGHDLTYAQWTNEFDAENRLTRKSYFNSDGHPTPGPDGFAVAIYRYDSAGNQVGTEYLGPDMIRVKGPDGYAMAEWEYSKGVLTAKRLFEPNGTSVRSHLDPSGHEIEAEYLTADGQLRPDATTGCARVTRSYGAGGDLLDAAYFDEHGQPCVAADVQYASVHWIEKEPKIWVATFKDARGNPTANAAGAISFILTRTDDPHSYEGRQIRPDGSALVMEFRNDLVVVQTYYDPKGRLSDDNSFYASRVEFVYDAEKHVVERLQHRGDGSVVHIWLKDDLIAEMRCFDASGAPSENDGLNAARVTYRHDAKGRLIERTRYYLDGVVEHETMNGDVPLESLFTDASGAPTADDRFDAPRVTFTYDGKGWLVRRDQYGGDGLVERYTIKDDVALESAWFDAQDRPVNGPLGYAHCTYGSGGGCADATDTAGRKLVRTIFIVGVNVGSAAEQARIKPGDRVVSYDGTPASELGALVRQISEPGPSPRMLVVARQHEQLAISVPPGRLGIRIEYRYLLPVELASP